MIESTAPRYFAASNSSRGFCNYYGDIFTQQNTDRLYIIKGGPGTGKSHFMKAVARHARMKGYSVTEYACSSDPASLDGIWMKRDGSPSVGLLDGTAPHVREPLLPGVKEEIVNLGVFWNNRLLMERGDAIHALTAQKSAAYDRVYAYLAACGNVDLVAESRMDGCVLEARLQALADRILRHQPKGTCFSATPALRRAVSMMGEVCLHTFERSAAERGGSILVLEDHYGLAYRLTRMLLDNSRAKHLAPLVSYHPVYTHKIDGLYYPDSGLCILVGHAEPPEGTATRSISLRRYADPMAVRAVRSELRAAYALRNQLTEAALRELTEAAKCHFELESIYTVAMDFRAKEAFTEDFCKDLFKRE